MSTIITEINPTTLEVQSYSSQDVNLISTSEKNSQFDPFNDYIEYTIISSDGSFQITDQNYLDFAIIQDPSPSNSSIIYSVDIDSKKDLTSRGFNNGSYNVIYKFLKNELNSSSDTRPFYIKEISSDRTEIKIASNIIPNEELETSVNTFIQKLDSTTYFEDFYLNFGSNSLIIANNILVDNTKSQYEILINLYETLPNQFRVKDTLWVVTEVADPLAFNIQFQPEVIVPIISNPTIKGPNFDLGMKDRINNSSNYINYDELLNTGTVASYQQILSYLTDKSINIGIDYSEFENFVHFSSAKTRVENFYYKVQLIEQYNSDLTTIQSSDSSSIVESVAILEDKIENIIENFDGFEYYIYFSSGSITYPKANSIQPYALDYSLNPTVLTWLGSDNPQSLYYGGLILSASMYDEDNQDFIINTIPDYLLDDSQNQPYTTFIEMMGHFYDNIWIYYKDVSNRYNGDNRLNSGISKDLVADALRSFGIKLYQNNFSTSDLYNAFTGFNILSGSFDGLGNVYVTSSYITEGEFGYFVDDDTVISTGDELITNFITASQEAFYTPIDDVNKEIYKRLYHNLPLLLKQKGTIAGLRNLINIYGIPDTILRISEFGGRDKDVSTYDYFHNRYSYALFSSASDQAIIPWDISDFGDGSSPSSIFYRIKPNGVRNSINQCVLLKEKISNSPVPDFTLTLQHTGSGALTSGSYDGSIISSSAEYGTLTFHLNVLQTTTLNLPFFNGDWWSIGIVYDSGSSTVTLYAGQDSYNGYDGNTIKFFASSSLDVISGLGNIYWVSYPGNIKLSNETDLFLAPSVQNDYFDGSYQELRLYNMPLTENEFKEFVMNPTSLEGLSLTGSNSSFNTLSFRAPLGNELYNTSSNYIPYLTASSISQQTYILTSSHPAIQGNSSLLITQSFGSTNNSGYRVILNQSPNSLNPYSGSHLLPNTETYFFNQPIAGLRNRITDKIQIVSSSYPSISLLYTQSGDTLSQYIVTEQQFPSQGSETPDVNALEVAFSPQNEVDDDIIGTLGYFNIGEYIGDPRQAFSSSTYYPDLYNLSKEYFEKYDGAYQLYDYVRLVKYLDNSLFKMIKDFVPARTNLRSGIVIKQHLLERNKYPQPQIEWEDVTYSGSIDTAFITGSTGGVFNEFNNLNFSQSWLEFTLGPSGSTYLSQSSQAEFYNGELPGTVIEATDGELNDANPYKYPSTLMLEYDIIFYSSSVTSIGTFNNINTSPNQGQIYLWYDTGSYLNPGQGLQQAQDNVK